MMTLRPYRMFFALALALGAATTSINAAVSALSPQTIPVIATSAAAQFICLLLMHLLPRRGNAITALHLCCFFGVWHCVR